MDMEVDIVGSDRGSEEDRATAVRRRTRDKLRVPPKPVRRDDKLPQLHYREGDSLRDLATHLSPEGAPSQLVEVAISSESLSNSNRQVRARQLWGDGVYTEDSDLVAVLMHCGYFSAASSRPPAGVSEVRVLVQPLPVQDSYASASRNGIRSRAWGGRSGRCSYQIKTCSVVSHSGDMVDLEPGTSANAAAVVPTFTPAQFERIMNTRASASSIERRQRTMQEVTIQYNLCNEPWLKYSMAAIADRGLKASQWTSARLRDEVLLLETPQQRYELSRVTSSEGAETQAEQYRWARCTSILPLSKMWSVGLPLPAEHLQVLHANLAWEDCQWSVSGGVVKGQFYPLVRLHFTDRRQPGINAAQQSKAAMNAIAAAMEL
ncbi:hypothetical protein WJX72_007737 [[Myrmecia] bisecta]|uniref:Uncharacterized protein n=1 Tax=[Myrmecia] bisecta TaxID=41462 RepID=A0AAW1QRM3_9CHLO